MKRWIVVAAGMLLAGCVTSAGKPGGKPSSVAPFDAQVLRALQGQDIAGFVAGLPPTTEPPKKMVDASYDLPASGDGGEATGYVVLIHRKTHEVWFRRGSGKTAEVFGPTVYNQTR